jgi:membrane protein
MTAIPHGHRGHHADQHDQQQVKKADDAKKPGLFNAVKEIANEFSEDDVMTQSAALAFYAGLAVAPLLTVIVWISQVFFGAEAKQKIVEAFQQVVGGQAAGPIKELLNPASEQAKNGMTLAGIVSIVILAFSASSVFGQLQSALNSIWDVKAKPGSAIWGFINKRLLSLGMLLSIFFLLMVSLVVSAGLQAFTGKMGGGDAGWLWTILEQVVSVGVFTVLFAGLFKYVPDAKISWRAVWIGAVISAVLFAIGKFALALYLGRGSYESSYGVAVGSFVALLVWVYYSSIIVLVGAEVTEVYARRNGHAIEPSDHAVRVIKEERQDPNQGAKKPDGPKPQA